MLAATLLLAGVTLQLQDADSRAASDHSTVPTVRAERFAGSISIDGRLDEADWALATPAVSFTQLDPNEGESASERTEVRFLINGNALFVGARMYDRDPGAIKTTLARRDASADSDLFEILLDPYHDHLTGVQFRINPSGSIREAVIGSGGNDDPSWDPVWEAAARVDSLGWTAEMRIPLSQLRYNPAEDAVWGIQMGRSIYRKGEVVVFSFVPKTESFGANRYGHLVGLGRVEPQRQVEVMPYTSARAEYTDVPSGNPFRDGNDYFGNAGVDLKYGITSDVTLDVTVNPDFGQVEVDPAVVNLTAFETFFPEKRPFFIEGADLFRFGGIRTFNSSGFPRFFFSRRIGRRPQGRIDVPGAGFTDVPDQSTILGAAKLTGRTSSGWSIGILESVTAEEHGRYLDSTNVVRRAPVEPASNRAVARIRKDLRAGNSTIGGMVSTVNRDMSDESLAALLPSSAYFGGVDFTHAWGNREFSFDGMFALSRVSGTADAISRLQRSSARYFQRPDQESARFDATKTALDGHAWQISLAKNSGKNFLGSLTFQDVSPEFEVNELGFQTRAGTRALSWTYGYRQTRPAKVIRNWSVYPFTNHVWNYDGDLTFQTYSVLGFGRFTNFWRFFWRFDYQPSSTDDRLTRGGPLARTPRRQDFVVELETDSRKTTQVEGSVFYRWDDAGGSFGSYDLELSFRPTTAARISIGPNLSLNENVAQYITTIADPAAAKTFGSRYIFGRLDQTELSLVTRVDWTFTPNLSLQLFLQPLISSGNFSGLKELAEPHTFDFVEYGRDRGTLTESNGDAIIDPGDGGTPFEIANRDFNIRSLRANAVLRWEYRPGSTLFVIWQQSREGFEPFGDFSVGRDFRGIFDSRGDNILAVKLSYWLGI